MDFSICIPLVQLLALSGQTLFFFPRLDFIIKFLMWRQFSANINDGHKSLPFFVPFQVLFWSFMFYVMKQENLAFFFRHQGKRQKDKRRKEKMKKREKKYKLKEKKKKKYIPCHVNNLYLGYFSFSLLIYGVRWGSQMWVLFYVPFRTSCFPLKILLRIYCIDGNLLQQMC